MTGLRIMMYDKTDVRGWTKQISEHAPGDIGLLVDELDIQVGLTHTWITGGWLYRKLGRFDYVAGFDSWEAALTWLCELEPENEIAEIQFWGHGSPGKAWMNGTVLTKNSFLVPTYGPLLQRIKTRLTSDSLLWFRCCSLFCAQAGHDFASTWVRNLGCRVAAHTYVIALFQSGLYCLNPGVKPWWSKIEGINEGNADKPISIRWSTPWSPRTIFALRSRLPSWADAE